MTNIRQYIEYFEGDSDDYEKLLRVFVKVRNFLKIIVKYNLQDEIDMEHLRIETLSDDPGLWDFLSENGFLEDFKYDPLEDEVKISYLIWGLDNNPHWTLNFIANNLLSDVEIRNDGYWLRLLGREELAEFFSDSGRDNSKYVAGKVFSEDGLGHDWYYDSSINVFDDVISNLNKKNLERLGQRIVEELENIELSLDDYNDPLFRQFSEQQKTEGIFKITKENVMILFNNEAALKELFKKDLGDLEIELINIYHQSENTAYEDEVYDAIYDGLDEFFDSKIDEVRQTQGDRVKYIPYIKIKDFHQNMYDYLMEQDGYYVNSIEYIGSYTGIINELIYTGTYSEISVRLPEYPDWDRTRRLINDYFDI